MATDARRDDNLRMEILDSMNVKQSDRNAVIDVAPELAAEWLESGQAVLIDVREDFEHAAERIGGALHCPLSRLEIDDLRRKSGDKRIVFHCRTGKRSSDAARRFQSDGEPAFHLAGGIEAWKSAGLRTERPSAGPRIDVMRQTQMLIGLFVLSGVLLGSFVSPWFLLLSGFMGAGLIFAGLSGTCGMAFMLAKLPWNRVQRVCRTTCSTR